MYGCGRLCRRHEQKRFWIRFFYAHITSFLQWQFPSACPPATAVTLHPPLRFCPLEVLLSRPRLPQSFVVAVSILAYRLFNHQELVEAEVLVCRFVSEHRAVACNCGRVWSRHHGSEGEHDGSGEGPGADQRERPCGVQVSLFLVMWGLLIMKQSVGLVLGGGESHAWVEFVWSFVRKCRCRVCWRPVMRVGKFGLLKLESVISGWSFAVSSCLACVCCARVE